MKKEISRRTVIAAGAAPLIVPARALSLQIQKQRVTAGSPDSYAKLTAGFRSPSQETRPWVYWFPLNGNLTREGITADLESMARVGIGGLLYMEVDQGAPKGAADFAGPLWRELFKHACKEARRLGLQINMNNDAGWCGSGGPWITPELSMQKVVWSETAVQGGKPFEGTLPQPAAVQGFYRDIAVLAFPALAGEQVTLSGNGSGTEATFTSSGSSPRKGHFLLPQPGTNQPSWVQVECPQPFTARILTVRIAGSNVNGRLEISNDGKTFRPVKAVAARPPALELTFDAQTARFFRISFTSYVTPRTIDVSDFQLSPRYQVPDYLAKASFVTAQAPPARAEFAAVPAEFIIHRDHIVDLTRRMDAAGKLTWEVPPGNWTILRFGHTTTGVKNHPAPEPGLGLECDKLSREAAAAHFNGLMGKVIADNTALTGQGKTLVSLHIDSWEVGSQNWTPMMREEFRRRRGYDLLPYLLAFTGRVVESGEVTERFLWDLRQTVSDLLVENYAGEMRRLGNRHGLRLSIEAYGEPADDMTYAGQADEPMAEFWSWAKYGAAESCTEMASAAHTYGKRILGAEAFTARNDEKWLGHPAFIKDLGDWAFCEGINRFVFHRYAAQPWTHYSPGMSMGPWGLHYERTQTWWEFSKPWHDYLARCQYLLREGLFVADVLYLQPEKAPIQFKPPAEVEIAPHIRGGYNFDGCTPEVVLTRLSVKNGRLVLPDGMSYRVLVLPDVETMTPRLLRKIKDLVDAGATVIGAAKPPVKSPSLAEMRAGDAEVKKVAEELWASGKIIAGKSAAEMLAGRGVKPDFSSTNKLRYIHRTLSDTEIYFVANPEPQDVEAVATFRVAGKQPEFWWPDIGRIEKLQAFEERDGVTSVPLRLGPSGSVFVVFRKPTGATKQAAGGRNWREFKTVQTVAGPWQVRFDPKWGGPADAVTFASLEDWTKRPEEGIKYYSGTATYRTSFQFHRSEFSPAIWLDLGKVAVMAEVHLNGKNLGILWKPPFRVEVTDAVKEGENTLELRVINLWINRQIGDEHLPEDSDRNPNGTLKSWPPWVQEGKPSPTGRYTFTDWRLWKKDDPLVESGLLGPVTIQAAINAAG